MDKDQNEILQNTNLTPNNPEQNPEQTVSTPSEDTSVPKAPVQSEAVQNTEPQSDFINAAESQADAGASAPTYTAYASAPAPEGKTVYITPPSGSPYTVPSGNSAEEGGKKKAKSERRIAPLIITAVICVLLSGAAAFGGTVAAKYMLDNNASTDTQADSAADETEESAPAAAGTPSVIYESVNSDSNVQGGYTAVAEAVLPTVVEITTETQVSTSFIFGDYVTQGAGSGVVITNDGYIITNNHVISGAENITVTLHDGTTHTAVLVGTDADTDVAVLKIEASNLKVAVWSTSDVKVGEEVLAVGNPLGQYGGTVTNGIISALSRDITIEGTEMSLIQTNAAVNPGNSGGGLFNLNGELIGIVNAKTTTSSSGTSVEGIGFAIPGAQAKKVAEDLITYGYVKGKVVLGIEYKEITSTYDAYRYGVNALGVYVVTSQNDALKPYDRIIAVDGSDVSTPADIKAAIKGHSAGDKLQVTVVRNGKLTTVEVTLQEYQP